MLTKFTYYPHVRTVRTSLGMCYIPGSNKGLAFWALELNIGYSISTNAFMRPIKVNYMACLYLLNCLSPA